MTNLYREQINKLISRIFAKINDLEEELLQPDMLCAFEDAHINGQLMMLTWIHEQLQEIDTFSDC